MTTPFFRSEHILKSDTFARGAWGLLIAGLLMCLWLVWFFRARVTVYSVSDTADVEVDRAAHPIESQYPGRVVASTLALDRGVKEGEVLVELDADVQKLQLNEEHTRLVALRPQLSSLEDQISAERKASEQEHRTGSVALDEARAHFRETGAAADFADSEARRLKQMYDAGVLSKVDWERAQANALQRRAAAESLGFAVSKLERQQLTDQEDRQARLQGLTSERNRLSGLAAVTDAAIKRLEDEVDRRLIRAPVSGRLGEVASVRVGSVVREGEKLAAIVPTGTLRIVATFHPSDALGRIQPGQSARLRLEGFPWTQFGSVPATVTGVASEVRDGRIRVELAVNPHSTPRIHLQHGLPGTVEVQVEEISPAALVLRMVGRFGAKPNTVASAESGALR
jgi:membrane fusion protein (multidrug efflux system)